MAFPETGPLPTRLDIIFLAIQAQLMLILDWPAERVLIMDPDDLPSIPQADAFLCAWPYDETPHELTTDPNGRVYPRFLARCGVQVFTRTIIDETTSALGWLTDATLGHIVARHQVYDALYIFQPEDADTGRAITNCPIHPRLATTPRRGFPNQKRSETKEWGHSRLQFIADYQLDIDQSRQ